MPRYYFHIIDEKDYGDSSGLDLADLDAAKLEALRFAGAVISDERPSEIWKNGTWSLEVTDSPVRREGCLLLSLAFLAREH